MRPLCLLTVTLLTLLPCERLAAADAKWLHLGSAHFDLYTSESESDAKAALVHLETTRAYFLATTRFHDPAGKTVRIVAFRADADYSKYKPDEIRTSRAYGLAGVGQPTIVVAGLKPEVWEQIFREYAQLVLDDSAPTLPYWFRSGLAAVYSTVKPSDAGMILGSAPRSNFRAGQVGDVDLQLLFSVNREALLASREKGANDFYAATTDTGANNGQQALSGSRDPNGAAATALNGVQSSLSQSQDFARSARVLVHMLMFQQDYRSKFGLFMRTLAAGGETGSAFSAAYGAPISKIAADLNIYAKQTGVIVVTMPFKAEKPASPDVKPVAKEELDRILGDLGKR